MSRLADAPGSQSWEPGDHVAGKLQSAAAGAERPATWRDAEVVMEDPEPERQWQPGGSVPADEQGPGIDERQMLAVRKLFVCRGQEDEFRTTRAFSSATEAVENICHAFACHAYERS